MTMKSMAVKASLMALAFALPSLASAQSAAPQPISQTTPRVPIVDPLMSGSQPAPTPGQTQPSTQVMIPATSGRALSSALKPLNLEQKAWDNPQLNKSARQTVPGFLKIQWHPDALPVINMREGLLTVIKFPVQEDITTTVVSDPGSFEASPAPNRHSLEMRSLYAGVDGNVIIHGSSGNVYNFILRSQPYDAAKITDVTVEVMVAGMSESTGETEQSMAPTVHSYSGYNDVMTPDAVTDKKDFAAGSREYGRTTPLDPRNMRNNIDIKVRTADDQAIAPISAWHDDHFTYLDFGPRASSMNTWPVASLVVQGVESPVGTRVTGRDRSMMIIESVGNITLRNGQLLVCLNIVEPNNDGRYSIPVANTDPRPEITKSTPQIVHVSADAGLPPISDPVVAPLVIGKAQSPTKTPMPSEVAVSYPNQTATSGQSLWTALQKKHPKDLAAATPHWADSANQIQPYAPDGDTRLSIRVTGMTLAQAMDLCPSDKSKDKVVALCIVSK